ncbi:hypothetical protein [Inoviridae sp.]|nr:hypothetical protein [Inoviridae sp.]UOF78997.1 hypothetical protein [Inoviridae sp.]UOF81651.1 hypothetical protein [Inoviridae sp.]
MGCAAAAAAYVRSSATRPRKAAAAAVPVCYLEPLPPAVFPSVRGQRGPAPRCIVADAAQFFCALRALRLTGVATPTDGLRQ